MTTRLAVAAIVLALAAPGASAQSNLGMPSGTTPPPATSPDASTNMKTGNSAVEHPTGPAPETGISGNSRRPSTGSGTVSGGNAASR